MSAILVPLLTGGGSATVITTGVGTIVVKVLKRVAGDIVRAELAPITAKIQDLTVKVAAETGGNSNGLRQAINAMQKDIVEVRVDVASLKGTLAPKPAA